MATRYHALDDRRGRKAVERDGWFIGFIEPQKKSWRAFDTEMTLIASNCPSEIAAANQCWIERKHPLVKMSVLFSLAKKGGDA